MQEPVVKLFKETAEKEKPLAKYFYSINNQHELTQMGSSYLQDYKDGSKSFAITSTGYKSSQQRTILALASYFDHLSTQRIAIVSNQLDHGAFHDLVEAGNKTKLVLPMTPAKALNLKRFYHHFDFVEFDEIVKLAPNGVPNFEFEHAISEFVKQYDLIFWDVPEIEAFRSNHKLYYPISLYFDSLTIIVSQSLSKAREVEELQKFFLDYGVNIKGLLLDYTTKNKPDPKGFDPFKFFRRTG